MMNAVCASSLFCKPPLAEFHPRMAACSCGAELQILKTTRKTVWTLEIGPVTARQTILQCKQCHAIYDSEELKRRVPEGCSFGYDIIEYIGTSLFLKSRNVKEIQADLKEKNIDISLREIGHLGNKFIIYLALAHKDVKEDIRAYLALHGGYILHLDATCDGSSPHLMTALDEVTELILGNVKLPSEKAERIIPFLKQIQRDYGDPAALVHDMGKGILLAVSVVFPGTPDFICHFHFLRDIGKDLFGKEYAEIRNTLKKYQTRSLIRELIKTMKERIDNNPEQTRSLNLCLQGQSFPPGRESIDPIVGAYLSLAWVTDVKSELSGYGFPFDREHFAYYQRLKQAYAVIRDFSFRNNHYLMELRCKILPVLEDRALQDVMKTMEEKTAMFDELRTAMRIALPGDKEGLNDNGEPADMKSIKEQVTAFRKHDTLQKAAATDEAFQKMITQIDRYWEKLFADPITVLTPTGPVTLQPQRTNNILERFFRDMRKHGRKRGGLNSMSKTLRAMITDTPLVINLNNPAYMKILLKNTDSLAERFAEIDTKLVRKELKAARVDEKFLTYRLKKVVRLPEFMQSLMAKS